MFAFAFLIGIYSYLIFLLGIAGKLFSSNILFVSIIFLAAIYFYFKSKVKGIDIRLDRFGKFMVLLITTQALINLIGALGPEISFDALWYHLTLPKIFLDNHSVFSVPGGLLYYSLFPKLGEMLYITALSIDGEVLAKLIHFSFGLLTIAAIYLASRIFLNRNYSLLACLIFSSNLVFGWESITSYVDLIRTFFEIMALWGILKFIEKGNEKDLIRSGVSLGFAVSSKLLALGSLPIFFVLIFLKKKDFFKNFLIFFFLVVLIPLPWFFYSFLKTGNPIYPIFTSYYQHSLAFSFNPIDILSELGKLFLRSDDPISPVYLILLPLVLVRFTKFNKHLRALTFYSILALIVWFITPRTGGGRFVLPYLPAFSILAAGTIASLKHTSIRKFTIGVAFLVALVTIFYRSAANYKYLPVIFGEETKKEFLTKNLNFNFGDFYDVDGFFSKTIKPGEAVLLYGFHNLYYVDFPFIHESWVKKGNKFKYIAVSIQSILPKRFSFWPLIYYNKTTGVKVYSLNKEWAY